MGTGSALKVESVKARRHDSKMAEDSQDRVKTASRRKDIITKHILSSSSQFLTNDPSEIAIFKRTVCPQMAPTWLKMAIIIPPDRPKMAQDSSPLVCAVVVRGRATRRGMQYNKNN